ncbi:hypothetical protein H4S01_005855 [Coemansia sp. RSA 2610]|nr:hypothetical protein H4S01_005855 [Coemansia sp. RSA 2610]
MDRAFAVSAPAAGVGFQGGLAPARKRRRPPYSYTALIAQAILVSEHKQLTLREIYDSINRMYPQICQGPDIGWQNTIRHNLSLNSCFKRIPRQQLPATLSAKLRGKGSYWVVDVSLMDPNTRKRLDEAVSAMPPSDTATIAEPANPAKACAPRPCKRAKTTQSRRPASVRCVSPTVQSPSPYFQNAAFLDAPKPAVKPYSRPALPRLSPPRDFAVLPHPHAPPRGRFGGRPASCHFDSRFPYDAEPWSDQTFVDGQPSAMPLPASPYLFGAAVSYARSTARSSSREIQPDMLHPFHPSSASSSTLGSCQNSPYSLSPAPSAAKAHDTGPATAADGRSSPSKHKIDHLLN